MIPKYYLSDYYMGLPGASVSDSTCYDVGPPNSGPQTSSPTFNQNNWVLLFISNAMECRSPPTLHKVNIMMKYIICSMKCTNLDILSLLGYLKNARNGIQACRVLCHGSSRHCPPKPTQNLIAPFPPAHGLTA